MMNKKLVLIAAISYTILLFFLTSMPSKNIPTDVNDKTAHVLAFAVFAVVWLAVRTDYFRVILTGILFGIFIEVWQGSLPESFHRSFEFLDMVADGVGTLLGCVFVALVNRLKLGKS